MSAMSGLPISALANGRSERSTWLLLSGTASSPALTPSASLTLICAAAGPATPKAAAAIASEAPSAAPLNDLADIGPHLIILGFGSPRDADRRRWIDRRARPESRAPWLAEPCDARSPFRRREQSTGRLCVGNR